MYAMSRIIRLRHLSASPAGLRSRGTWRASFRKLDGQRPVTIGFAFESTMKKYVDDVDVLVFHNFLRTRGAV
jgi:hypothetical protein